MDPVDDVTPHDPTTGLPGAATLRHDRAAIARLQHEIDSGRRPAPWLHREIARRMGERLALVRKRPDVVLDWWAQAGAGSEVLKAQYPDARLVALDTSGETLAAPVRPRTGWRQWLPAREPVRPGAIPPAGLLWSNMMLHWVDDLPALFARWHAAIEVDGFLMFSCFGPDTLRELHALYAEAGLGPAGSLAPDMHDIGDALVHAGFADPVMDMERLTLHWADTQSLLDELRELGRNTHPARHPGLRTPRWRADLAARLADRLRGPGGRLQLSFEIVYGHAFRPIARARVTERTEISLDAMREMARRRNPEQSR